MLGEQSQHIAALISHAKANEARCIETTPEAEEEWIKTIKAKALNALGFLMECTPGYYNNEGKPEAGTGLAGENYGGGPVEFYDLVRKWRAEGDMKGIKIS
jgi:hypothetical protein